MNPKSLWTTAATWLIFYTISQPPYRSHCTIAREKPPIKASSSSTNHPRMAWATLRHCERLQVKTHSLQIFLSQRKVIPSENIRPQHHSLATLRTAASSLLPFTPSLGSFPSSVLHSPYIAHMENTMFGPCCFPIISYSNITCYVFFFSTFM